MLETLGFDAKSAALWAGLLIGLLFGGLAEVSRFCLRRGLVGQDRREPLAMFLIAMVFAIAGTQLAQHFGLIDVSGHRYLAAKVPVFAIVGGGLIFGIGMTMTRGCPARMTVLAASGNMRALIVLVFTALTALAMMKGLLQPLLAKAQSYQVAAPHLSQLPYVVIALPVVLALLALLMRVGLRAWAFGGAIGLLVPLAWLTTGNLLQDDFDPTPLEAISFIAPIADTLFWVQAATALTPGFGVGLVLGTFLGAAITAQIGRRGAWQSFSSPRETGRYLSGAVLMGIGGVLAGGCTLGAGLSGVSTLSISALVALGSIILATKLSAFVLGD